MSGHDIVVMGASAGGIEALREVAKRLPKDLKAAVFVVVHMPRGSHSNLPEIISRSGPLPATHPKDGEKIEHGRIYVAPPDNHMLIQDGVVRLTRGPHHNRHRPAVDPLFSSAAHARGSHVVGVVLSGTLDDGTAGLARIKRAGGIAIVQDPATATYAGMPQSAATLVKVDQVVPLLELGPAIEAAVRQNAVDEEPATDPVWDRELEAYMGEFTNMEELGRASVYACPECHGVLWELDQDGVLQFRCRVGHSYSSESLLAEHDGTLEASLYAALRALEENASLRRKLAERMHSLQQDRLAKNYETRAKNSERHASMIRDLLTSKSGPSAAPSEES